MGFARFWSFGFEHRADLSDGLFQKSHRRWLAANAGRLIVLQVFELLRHLNLHLTMNLNHPALMYPDHMSVPSELSFEESWDGEAVSELIRSKCDHGETPAFLFLGRKEAGLLKEHLAEIFGEDSVITLNGTYYKGLVVVTIDCESFLATGGRKTIRTLQDPISRRPAWRDRDTETLWQFRI